ncbi:MAG: carotenoid biosynthesis protein, partial [Rhodothermales bacterium]|nr:carotenoid biosynthesis protein [Rhodothermales bacterium]
VGAGAELLGTTTGFPFGSYFYTHWLGPQMLGHVPWFIPPSWFALGLVSFDLASRLGRTGWQRIGLAAVFLTLWDVSLDPAMSRAFPFWTYPDGGFFYGMPLSNWVGWLFTGTVIMMGFEWMLRDRQAHSPLAPAVYLVNCLFPIGLSLLYGLWWAVLAGLVATFVVLYPVTPTVARLADSMRLRPA